jgi:uncharacterized protein (DUF1800 family)
MQPILDDLRAATLLRQVYSRRQLYELMVEFWTDHFNISMDRKTSGISNRWTTGGDPGARSGQFPPSASGIGAFSAMLTFLDNQANIAGTPNENRRELLGCTLGVDGGYTQQDVMGRCLTG